MKKQISFICAAVWCMASLSAMGMEKISALKSLEVKKQEEYQKQVYYKSDVSRTRAEAYCNLLCREQMGFAKALKYYSLHKNEDAIKPLESFLKRFSTEVIGRSIILRDFNLKEHEYGIECRKALDQLVMSECYLSYLITGKGDEGRVTKEQWKKYWQELDSLPVNE